jgi:hypothetical protein
MSDALFQSNSSPYGNFKSPGTNYQGTIMTTGQVHSRKFVPPNQRAAGKQGDLEYWPDGRPKMTAIITVQTNLRDPEVEGDDGQRSLWIKGKSMTNAVKGAIRAAGASKRGLEVGGWFSMTFTHETEPEFEGGSPTKHYEVQYIVPENNPHRAQAQKGDPWANVQPPDDFLVAPGTPVVQPPSAAPQRPSDPWATPAPQPQFGGPQGGAQGVPAPAYAQVQPPQVAQVVQPQAPAPAAPNPLAGLDVNSMSPEARAALEAMLAQQQGGQQ